MKYLVRRSIECWMVIEADTEEKAIEEADQYSEEEWQGNELTYEVEELTTSTTE